MRITAGTFAAGIADVSINTRNGRIARLPSDLRQQLNRRLEGGEPAEDVLAWLNAQPAGQPNPTAESADPAFAIKDLADWQETGHCDWRVHAEAREQASQLHAEVAELKQAGEAPLTDALAQFLAAQYVLATRAALRQAAGEPLPLPTLRVLCADVVSLRRGDHQSQRLRLERERLVLAQRDFELRQSSKIHLALDALCQEIKGNPAARAAFENLQNLVEPESSARLQSDSIRPNPTESD